MAHDIDDGGSAYPVPAEGERGGMGFVPREPGLSKREVFAMHALAGALANPNFDIPQSARELETAANGAFQMADAMIKAGGKRG